MKKENSMYPHRLFYGASFYPEVWGRIPSDSEIAHMQELHMNFVRMGEFAWSTLEPHPDEFHPELFLDTVEILGRTGIDTVFCTPGAAPPVWMTKGHEERCCRDRSGNVYQFGGRQHVCINNPEFRKRIAVITRRLVETFGRHKHVIAWQIDNELCSAIPECCCDSCAALWIDYLKKRYGTIQKLNQAWHTAVWSMTFHDFDDVPIPGKTTFEVMSPTVEQVYREFGRECALDFQKLQLDIIRAGSDAPVTLNDGASHHLNRSKQFSELDFASVDTYASSEAWNDFLSVCDLYRNLKPGVPFCIMETAVSQPGSLLYCAPIHPEKYLSAEVMSAFALGANALAYWHFRQHPAGHETPHSALLTSWGTPSVGFEEAANIGNRLDELQELLGNSAPEMASAALICSDLGRIQVESEPVGNQGNNFHFERISELASLLRDTFGGVEILPDHVVGGNFKLLWSPYMPYLAPEQIAFGTEIAKKGGVWLVGPHTGFRTRENTAFIESGLDPALESLAQVRTLWSYSAHGRESSERGNAFGQETAFKGWCSFFETEGAIPLGTACSGRSCGKAFLTEVEYGKGRIVILGADVDQTLIRAMLNNYAKTMNISLSSASKGSILVNRKGPETGDFAIAVNLDGLGGIVHYAGKQVSLQPYGHQILFP